MPDKLSPKKQLSPERQQEIITRTMDMGRHPRFTEDIAQHAAALMFKWKKRHPNMWIEPENMERLPKEGAYVASINHSDDDDSVFAKLLMKGRAPMVPGHVGLFENPITARLYRAMGAVPMVRAKDGGRPGASRAFEALGENLDDGEPIFIYDEGTRAAPLAKFGPGSSILAAKHKQDIYPIGFAGTYIKGSPVAVFVGEPIRHLASYDLMPDRKVRKLMHEQLQPAMEESFTGAYELLAKQTGQNFDEIFPGFAYESEDIA